MTEVAVSAPPPDCAKVIGAFAPTVARLLAVVAKALLFAMLIAAAPAPLVVALSVVVCVASWVELPMPVTAVAVRLLALISVPAPLPWIEPVRAVSVSAFVPALRIVTDGALALVVAP